MKKLLLILSVVVLLTPSCSKSLLDQMNPNTLSVEEFWKTEADAEKGVNAIYGMFYQDGTWARWIFFRLDLTSDEGVSKSPWIELGDWTRFQYVNYDFWEGNNWTWRDTYKAIFRCNQVLKYVPDIEFSDPTKKERILAQAKFLRAFHYYYAALMCEKIPIVLDPPVDPGVQHPESLFEDVWAQVEKDLNVAVVALPEKWDDANVGRPTKGSAYGMLARTYMQQHKWQQAKTALDYFFTGAGKDLYDLVDFKENFRATQENNKESVFEIQHSNENTGGDCDCVDNNMGSNRPQFFAPRGIGWSDGQARYWLVEEFKKEKTVDGEIDPRLRYSLFYPRSEE